MAEEKEKKQQTLEEKETKTENLTIEEIKERLAEYQKQRDEYLTGWQRERADFLNYKNEIGQRFEEITKYANINLIKELILILDSFDLAIQHGEKEQDNKYLKGVYLIKSQLESILTKNGLEIIKSKGEKFNPFYHEAVRETESSEASAGTIIEEIEKGYLLNGKVVRPAKVIIAKKPE